MKGIPPDRSLNKVIVLLLVLLPSLGLSLTLSIGRQVWDGLLLGVVAAGMVLAVVFP